MRRLLVLLTALACNGAEPTEDSMSSSESSQSSEHMSESESSETEAMECMTDICATYGAAVPDVASEIVDRAATDPQFADDFAPLVAEGDEAVAAFKESLTFFISDAYGCSDGLYTGPSMEAAHAGMGITQEEYDSFIVLIAGVLSDAGVPDEDISQCFAPPLVDPAFANTIIGQ